MAYKLEIIDEKVDSSQPKLASEECQQLISIYEHYYPKIGFEKPWVGYFIIRGNEVVGSCGFTGKPNSNKVELAYWTFKKHEGQGASSFACQELVKIAQSKDPKLTITAKTAPGYSASTKILEKNNFSLAQMVQDDDIGDSWLWILND